MGFLSERVEAQSAVRKMSTMPAEEAESLEKAADDRSAKIKRAMARAKEIAGDGEVPAATRKAIFADPGKYLSENSKSEE